MDRSGGLPKLVPNAERPDRAHCGRSRPMRRRPKADPMPARRFQARRLGVRAGPQSRRRCRLFEPVIPGFVAGLAAGMLQRRDRDVSQTEAAR